MLLADLVIVWIVLSSGFIDEETEAQKKLLKIIQMASGFCL